jgi:hypothetical protein
MKNIVLSLSLVCLLAGCTSYYPPKTSMYSDYGFTYDYNKSPVPSAVDVPSTERAPTPTILVQVPPPTVINQTTPPAVQSSIETSNTNATAATTTGGDANPYRGNYVIPPKVIVVPQQTIIRETAGAPTQGAVTADTSHAQQPQSGYPGVNYVTPSLIGVPTTTNVSTNTPGTNTPGTNTPGTNTPGINPPGTNSNGGITNKPGGGGATNNLPPFTPLPGTGSSGTPPNATPTPSGTPLQRSNRQSTSGSGTGAPAQSTSGGSFAPPPPNTTPVPGTQPTPRE